MNYKLKPLSIAVLGGILTLSGCTETRMTQSETGTIELRIVETTDIHANVMSFDYYKGKESSKIGLARAATLVKQVRSDATNSVLVDNGDLIQGSPMGDYIADRGMTKTDVHPVYKAMNQLDYEVGNFGNHEFNYGLEFLAETINDASFPYINANVFDEKTGEHYFKPYLIKTYQLKDTDGNEHDVKIGYIGFVPPQIKIWDKKNLEGKVVVKDILETAELLVPEMKEKGADIIIAIPHSGISSDPHVAGAENSIYYLSQVEGIDAITFGHAHAVFPSKTFADLKGVDLEKGTINGTPAVMPGRWGSHIGVIDLTLKNEDGEWNVVDAKGESLPIYDRKNKKSLAKADAGIVAALEEDHQHTLDFVNQPIGKADDVMYSYLSLVQDDPTVQIVNNAQRDYVEQFIQGDPDLDGIAVLSAAAPFKAGGRKNDPGNFTEVEAGQLTFKNAADLYLYPNTLVAMKVTGKEVKEWLECSAGQFNQIDAKNTKPQFLINWDEFRTYNFDTLDGVNYQIDVTQPAKYDGNCKVINPDAHRIVNLTYKGKAIDTKQPFLIATNNYRAYSAKFAGTGEDFIAFASPDENRSILSAYISKVSKKEGMVKVKADNNWSFAPIKNGKNLDIRFETSPTEKAAKFVKDKAQYPMTFVENDEVGFAVYKVDLSK